MRLTKTLLLAAAALAANGPDLQPVDPKSLYPNLVNFESRQTLVESYAWKYVTSETYVYSPQSSAFYIEDTNSVLVMVAPKTRDLISAGKRIVGLGSKDKVRLMEIDLGHEVLSVGTDYFPLLTVSATFSSGMAIVEREIGQSYTITFTGNANREFDLRLLGVRAGTGVTLAESYGEREIITCMANPGGRVQLQVSNSMVHFPQARTRKVTFFKKDKAFKDEAWDVVQSTVANEEHMGALFYETYNLGKHRCVTEEEHFEDAGVRKWLEWSKPYSKTPSLV